jgi:hypothetical protein
MSGHVIVRCGSRRARRRLVSALGRRPQAVFRLDRDCLHGAFAVSPEELATALAVNGVTRARSQEGWAPCWPTVQPDHPAQRAP